MIEKTFAHHAPGPDAVRKIEALRSAFSRLSQLMEALCPESGELAEARKLLKTTSMWAISSVVLNDPASKVAGDAP